MRSVWKYAALAAIGIASSSHADDYPSRPIRLVVPYTAGGGADTVARIVTRRVGEAIGQTIVIENRGGAGAILGTDMVAKAEPDGYTLLLGQSGPISINPAVYKDLRYDPVRDFAPITMTTAYPYILAVNAKLPVKSLQEFVALAKRQPGAMNYGTTGVGAANHLVAELFNGKAGLKMTHIPYRGTALAVADLVGGQVTMVLSDPVSVLPHLQSGALRGAGGDQHAALAGGARPADHRGERLSGLRRHRLARHPGAGEDAAQRDQEVARRDRQGAAESGDQGLAGQAGHAAGREHAGGVRRLHQAGHRGLEGGRGRGGRVGEVTG